MSAQIYFVSGIDTAIGKTFTTGFLAKNWNEQGIRTITQKLIQTGNVDISEDIEQHRAIMGCGLLPEDQQKLTMPEIFTYPASPHLAARLDGRAINFEQIQQATEQLAAGYDCILLEGAGGLMVPLTEEFLTIDYIQRHNYPVILVTSGRLGSINHTLLSLELLKLRGVQLYAIAFNHADNSKDPLIAEDTIAYLKQYLQRDFADTTWVDIPALNLALSSHK